MFDERHHKQHLNRHRAERERAVLRLVAGDGVAPTCDGAADEVVTQAGRASVADLLSEDQRLDEAEVRGIGVAVADALDGVHARGIVHGDIKPANVVFAPAGGLWLIDFDASGPSGANRTRGTPSRLRDREALATSDDVVALGAMLVECLTGVVIECRSTWPAESLIGIGCPLDLARDLAMALTGDPTAAHIAGMLSRRPHRLRQPATTPSQSPDRTPTIDFASGVIPGLEPRGASPAIPRSPAPPGWQRWARGARG